MKHWWKHARSTYLCVLCALLVLPACGDCNGDIEEPEVPITRPEHVPADRALLARAFAEHIPANAYGLMVARGFEDFGAMFSDIEDRMKTIFDLGTLREDLRNQFGIDIHRELDFVNAGVSYHGGFMLSWVQQQPVIGVFITDETVFVERFTQIFRDQPWALEAPVEEEMVGTYTLYYFRERQMNEHVKLALVVGEGLAFIIARESVAPDVREVARAIAQTTEANSLAANPEFDNQAGRFQEYPNFLYVDIVAMVSTLVERHGDTYSASYLHTIGELQRAVPSFGAGFLITDQEISALGYASVTAETAAFVEGIDVPAGHSESFQQFQRENTFFTFRIGANPMTVWQTILRFQAPAGVTALHEYVAPLEDLFQVTLDGRPVETPTTEGTGASPAETEAEGSGLAADPRGERLTDLITGNAVLMLNRLSPLSLISGDTLQDYLDAVDFVMVFTLRDRDRLVELMDALVARSSGAYSRLDLEGGPVFVGNGEYAFGRLFIRDGYAVWGAERMRRAIPNVEPDGTGVGVSALPPLAQEFVNAESATGMYFAFGRLDIANITTLLGLPALIRSVLGFFDTAAVHIWADERGMYSGATLSLSAAP